MTGRVGGGWPSTSPEGTDLSDPVDGVLIRDVRALLERCHDATGLTPVQLLELDDAVVALQGLGLDPGSAVLLAVGSSRNLLTLHFAALLCGLAPLAVPAVSRSGRLTQIAAAAGAGALVTSRLPPGWVPAAGTVSAHPIGPYLGLRLGGPGRYPGGSVLMPTSGTSGLASACVHRTRSLLRNAARHAGAVGLTGADTVLVSLPLFYSFALVAQAYAALVTGARLVVLGPPFTPPSYLAATAAHGISSCSLTPTAIRMMLAHGKPLGVGVRMLTVGGDQLPAAQVRSLLATNPGRELYLTYGLTEAGPRVSTLAAHTEPDARMDSVGLPLPGTHVHLRHRGPDGVGELLVESDTLLVRKIGGTPGRRDLLAPGVLNTGDLFRLDADGYLRFAGRQSDVLVIRGEKISLATVRAVVQAVPGVASCTTSVSSVDGEHRFDLAVRVAGDRERVERDVRAALTATCLVAEQPSTLSFVADGSSEKFHK